VRVEVEAQALLPIWTARWLLVDELGTNSQTLRRSTAEQKSHGNIFRLTENGKRMPTRKGPIIYQRSGRVLRRLRMLVLCSRRWAQARRAAR
jgi:hypothetical protein